MNELALTNEKPLALSLMGQYQKDKMLLSKPITTLAKKGGINVEQVYKVLLPALLDKNLGEALKYAEVGLSYSTIVDRNRLREEIGLSYIMAIDIIIQLVQAGLESKEGWIKRKAIKLHAFLIDESGEKQRFVENMLVEQKAKMLSDSMKGVQAIEDEILQFEQRDNGMFEVVRERASGHI